MSIDQTKDDILIFVTPYWHLPVDLSFQHERARSSGTGRVIDEGISYKVPADRD